MTATNKFTDTEIDRHLLYKTADQFKKYYDGEYMDRLYHFMEDCSNTLYNHYSNNGTINFSFNKPDLLTTIGQIIFAYKCVEDMYESDFKLYDLLTNREKFSELG